MRGDKPVDDVGETIGGMHFELLAYRVFDRRTAAGEWSNKGGRVSQFLNAKDDRGRLPLGGQTSIGYFVHLFGSQLLARGTE